MDAVTPAVRHQNPNDLLLNTCQMRNAMSIQPLRIIPAQIDRDWAILAGARAEVDGRKKGSSGQGRGGAAGRGRGRGSGRGVELPPSSS